LIRSDGAVSNSPFRWIPMNGRLTPEELSRLRGLIRAVPDFPKPGILFRDITPLLADPWGFRASTAAMADLAHAARPDLVAAVEARGFLVGAAVALALGCGIVPVRKSGKLPYRTRRVTYALEYGTDAQEIHEDAVREGQRVLLVDDVLATGGTLAATVDLIRRGGGEVAACAVLLELAGLKGRERLPGVEVLSLLVYP
jgi:adenine phosphoribosyltransferase